MPKGPRRAPTCLTTGSKTAWSTAPRVGFCLPSSVAALPNPWEFHFGLRFLSPVGSCARPGLAPPLSTVRIEAAMAATQKIIVDAEYAGQRLDAFLAAQIAGVSRVRVQQLIAQGKVRVSGR